jgi:hypothetical protein
MRSVLWRAAFLRDERPLSCLTDISLVDENAEHNDDRDSDDQRRRVGCPAFCVDWACLLYQCGANRAGAPKKAGRFIGDSTMKFFHGACCNSLADDDG